MQQTGEPLGIETQLWSAADTLRGNVDASEYKHVVLGLLFLKYISDAFEELHTKLQQEPGAESRRPGRVPSRERLLGAPGSPLVVTPQEWPPLANTEAKASPPETALGVVCLSLEPLPSWPPQLPPQQ